MKLVSMELPENVTLVRDYDPSLPELAHDPDQIEQVLLNIVRNALQALGPEGAKLFCAPAPRSSSHCTACAIVWLLASTLRTTGRVFRRIFRTPCSTRWSAVAKAVPAWGYPLPVV